MSGFYRALPIVLKLEGGFVDDPDDRGGATNHGITQGVYDRWREDRGQEHQSVRKIQSEEVESIYHELYWLEGKCDAIPWPLSAAHFDACVNHGPLRAARLLQAALDVTIDGILGPQSLGAAQRAEPREALESMLWERLAFYRRISLQTQLKFLRGWIARLIHLREALT